MIRVAQRGPRRGKVGTLNGCRTVVERLIMACVAGHMSIVPWQSCPKVGVVEVTHSDHRAVWKGRFHIVYI